MGRSHFFASLAVEAISKLEIHFETFCNVPYSVPRKPSIGNTVLKHLTLGTDHAECSHEPFLLY